MEAKVNGILIISCHIRENFHSLCHLNLHFHYVYYHQTICTRNVEIYCTSSAASQVINYPIISDDSRIGCGTHSTTFSLDTDHFFSWVLGGWVGVIKWQQCEQLLASFFSVLLFLAFKNKKITP